MKTLSKKKLKKTKTNNISKLSSLNYFFKRCSRYMLHFLPINKNKIVFSNFAGRGYGDNPKYIAERLLKEQKKWKIVWLTNDLEAKFPHNVKVVKYASLKSFYELATAKIWIDNIRNSERVRKKKNQIYLQTWHGEFALKQIEAQVEDQLKPHYVKMAKKDGQICDGILAGNKVMYNLIKKSFWLGEQAEILKIGLPRRDFLCDPQYVQNTKEHLETKFHIEEDCVKVLYAPTFRDNHSIDCYKLDFEGIKNAFEKKEKKKCMIFVKLHPNIVNADIFADNHDFFINISAYPDIQKLYCMMNYVISDYSSVLIEFAAYLKRPSFICTLDLDSYMAIRGINEEYWEYPFPRAQTNDELIQNIIHFDSTKYKKESEEYFKKLELYTYGNSMDKILEWFEQKCK